MLSTFFTWLSERLGIESLRQELRTQHEEVMSKLDIQPPLADEKPQAVQVTIKPSVDDWNKFYDYEASQREALKEFEDQK